MFDPLMLSGRSRTANLFRRPFVEGSVGGGFIKNGTDDWGWSAEAEVQGYLPTPIPWAFYGQFSADRSDDFRTHTEEGFVDPDVAIRPGVQERRRHRLHHSQADPV